MKDQTKCSATRVTNPCDTCVIRRVKCGTERPCLECRKRGLECTSLRERRKRGPKGPRKSTGDKVRRYQKSIIASSTGHGTANLEYHVPEDESSASDAHSRHTGSPDSQPCSSNTELIPLAEYDGCDSPRNIFRIPLFAYYHFIDEFQLRLYPIWPVVCTERLKADMAYNQNDNETHALAAALCAATISQLRLAEHTESKTSVSSLMFALEAERLRAETDFRENCGLPSLLTAFFLHMYYSNAGKLRTAAHLLREAITCCQILGLHRPDASKAQCFIDKSLRLRVFWLLFISELTFAEQNDLPTLLQPIGTIPHYDEDDAKGADLRAFISLTHLFSFMRVPKKAIEGQQHDQDRTEIAAIQAKLGSDGDDTAFNDTQRVDLCVTRQWIRTLTWVQTLQQSPMSCHADDPAFSLFLPVQIGREVLSFFTSVDESFVIAHGYGMELKIFRMADTVLDIMMTASRCLWADGMVLGAGDVLSSLLNVIRTVGSDHSEFFRKLARRMGMFKMSALADQRVPRLDCPGSDIVSETGDRNQSCASQGACSWEVSTLPVRRVS